jgi:beta-lactamase class A
MSRMLSFSDNVAANILFDRVGAANVNAALRGLGLGTSGYVDDSLPTTAADMALLLEAIAGGGAVSQAASEEMLAQLASEAIDDRIPALLPAGTYVAHKTGSWEGATHDAGIVYSAGSDYVIVVLTDYGYMDNAAERISRLSRTVYDHYNP